MNTTTDDRIRVELYGLCGRPDCARRRGRNHVLCRRCWRQVGQPTRDAVWLTWRLLHARNMHSPAVSTEQRDRLRGSFEQARELAITEAEA